MNEVQALALSAMIEAPIAGMAVRMAHWSSRGPMHVALASAVATAVTHPQLWQAVSWGNRYFPQWIVVGSCETAVVAVEALLVAWMAQLRLHQAILVSLLANSASLLCGMLLNI